MMRLDSTGSRRKTRANGDGDKVILSAIERYFVRLALGLGPVNRATVVTRNLYQARRGTDSHKVWAAMEERGLVLAITSRSDGDLVDFEVSSRAARAVLRKDETIDRGTLALLDAVDAKIASKSRKIS